MYEDLLLKNIKRVEMARQFSSLNVVFCNILNLK